MPHEERLRRTLRGLLLACALFGPVAAAAEDLARDAAALRADVPHGVVLYFKHCVSCHGRQAWGDGIRVIPALAGQREPYIIAQLAGFISGARQGSAVHGPAMHDALQPPDVKRAQALRDLGAWLAQTAPNGAPEEGAGQALAAGKRAYAEGCAGCHGTDGAGTLEGTPALAGQHYSYLLTQLRGFTAGIRTHAAGTDKAALGTPDQQQAMADYLSRLRLRGAAGGGK